MKALSLFKPTFVAAFLILALESQQLLTYTNYYPTVKATGEILLCVALVLLLTLALLAVTSLIISMGLRRLGRGGKLAMATTEIISLTAIGLFYLPAIILLVKTNSTEALRFFWLSHYGIYPIITTLSIVLFRIFLRTLFKRILYSLVDLLWKPSIIAASLSLVWIVVFFFTQSVSGGSHLSSNTYSPLIGEIDKERPNIILITFDALSAKNMSLYGYDRKTTPFWEELAKESYVFDSMHSNAVNTPVSVASILTSKYPWTHGLRNWLEHIKVKKEENIAKILSDDYKSAAIVPSMYQNPDFIGLHGQFEQTEWVGFKSLLSPALSRTLSSIGISPHSIPVFRNLLVLLNSYHPTVYKGEPFDAAEKFIDREGNSPFFMWVHIWPPHDPHKPPAPFKGTYIGADEVVPMKFSSGDIPTQIDRRTARYDETVMYTDSLLKSFIEKLKESGHYDNSIILLSSDHGVLYWHDFVEFIPWLVAPPTMYEQIFSIPLLIHLPGQTKKVNVPALAEHVDLAPTILELIGKPTPQWMEGESLVPYMKDPSLASKKDKYSMIFFVDEKDVMWFSIYRGDYKLIYNLYADSAALFNIKEDPEEEHNIALTHLEIFSDLKRVLSEKIGENYHTIHGEPPEDNR